MRVLKEGRGLVLVFVMNPSAAPATRKLCKEIPLRASSYVHKKQQTLHKVKNWKVRSDFFLTSGMKGQKYTLKGKNTFTGVLFQTELHEKFNKPSNLQFFPWGSKKNRYVKRNRCVLSCISWAHSWQNLEIINCICLKVLF